MRPPDPTPNRWATTHTLAQAHHRGGALALVAVAFHAGLGLLFDGLPRDTFAGRWLAELGMDVSPATR